MKVSKRFVDRAKPALRRYQKVLESAKRRDVNESDTSVIVSDMLTDILGYDKYQEVTTEISVRSTFCDLAMKITPQELATVLQTDVLKREVVEGDKADAAARTVKRAVRRHRRAMKENATEAKTVGTPSGVGAAPASR